MVPLLRILALCLLASASIATTHINDGGTWRTPTTIHVNDAGTWRQLLAVYVNDSGTWRYVHIRDTSAPSTPGTPSQGTVTSTSIQISWTASTDNLEVEQYEIQRCGNSTCGVVTGSFASSTNSYNNTGLSSGTTHWYRVRALDVGGNIGAFSSISSSITTP